MKKRLVLLMLSLIAWVPSICARIVISDMGAARDWCDVTMLDRIEGIWEYPDDDTSVLIRKSENVKNRYDIIVVESADTRLNPGETIGYLNSSPDPDKFEMAIYRNKQKNGILTDLGKCYAQFDHQDESIIVKGLNVKFSIGLNSLLPSFWNLARLTLRLSVKNPLESLPKGLVRIYPSSRRKKPDYL